MTNLIIKKMKSWLLIAQLRVTNPENYKECGQSYSKVKKFGGEFLVRNGEYQIFDNKQNFQE